jgi:hypothetical protein
MTDTATAVVDAPVAEPVDAHKTAIGLADVLHGLVGRAQFNQDTEQAHHNAIRAFFADHLDTLTDEEKANRMAPVDLATPGAPSILMHGFTQAQFDAAVSKQVKASIGAEVQAALREFMAAQQASAVTTAAPAPPVSAPSPAADATVPPTNPQGGTP